MREFKINKYITLRLNGDETFIYIKGRQFRQCISVPLDIPISEIKSFREIESVDELIDNFDRSTRDDSFDYFNITPDEKFWVHCSNLQVWVENEFDSRLIHSNLAFPLLEKLVEVGDPQAKKVFKEEIFKRLESCYPPIVTTLIYNGYTDYLTEEELDGFFDSPRSKLVENLLNMLEDGKNLTFFYWDFFRRIIRKKPDFMKSIIIRIFNDERCNHETFKIIIGNIFFQYFSEEEQNTILRNPSKPFIENIVYLYNHTSDAYDPTYDDENQRYSTIHQEAENVINKIYELSPESLNGIDFD